MTQPLTIEGLVGDRKRRRRERRVKSLFVLAGLVSIAISVAIVVSLAGEAWSFLSQVELSELFTVGWFPAADCSTSQLC